MRLKFNIFRGFRWKEPKDQLVCRICIKHTNSFFPLAANDAIPSTSSVQIDLREEYSNAFRTESYNEFWARVLDLTLSHGKALQGQSTAKFPSSHIFTEQLLDPDQETVTQVLAATRKNNHPQAQVLLSEYYTETANASLLCGQLLKDIEKIRVRYRPLKADLRTINSDGTIERRLSAIDGRRADWAKILDPLGSFSTSQQQLSKVQDGSSEILKRLELGRRKARTKRTHIIHLKRTLSISLIIITASAAIIGACIALNVLVSSLFILPTLIPTSFRFFSNKWLRPAVSQLDAATKGAYILNRDLDTISRLVTRLRDEVEHMIDLIKMCFERRDDGKRRLAQEVVRQLWRNDASFNQQLDDLEEHLYLCFLTINKARNMVMKEVLLDSKI